MAQEDTAGPVRAKSSRLPIELAELLTPPLEHALNHPLRRQILRALHRAGEPCAAAELAASDLPNASVTLINYHAAVLEGSDLIRTTEREVAGQVPERRYASNVLEDVQILAVLGATEAQDRLDA